MSEPTADPALLIQTDGMLTDPQDEMIDLGHNLGLQVVAEGVESMPVLDRLAQFGCDVAQGFGIASPMSVDALVNWVIRAESHASTWHAAAARRRTGWPTWRPLAERRSADDEAVVPASAAVRP